ncbi:MAG: hypothetical protein AB1393_03195 [Candidatus Edwardsbacteria bacterium]
MKLRKREIVKFIRRLYEERGYLKIKRQTHTSHQGQELRFSTTSQSEANSLKKAMKALGFKSGKPFEKHSRIIIPYYGAEQVLNFFKLINPCQKRGRRETVNGRREEGFSHFPSSIFR